MGMTTSEITLKPIDNENHVSLFWESIKNEPTIDSMKKEDWVGDFIYDIYLKDKHVGFISYSIWEGRCCMSCIYVFPEYRFRGISTAAIRKLVYMTKDYNIFYGFVHIRNEIAIRLYQRLGFKFLNKERTAFSEIIPNLTTCDIRDNFYEFGVIRK